MNYKKADKNDIEGLTVLFDGYRVFYKKDSNLAKAKEFLKNRIANNDSQIFVAENSNGLLIGFVQLYPLFSSTRMEKLWLLNDLYVDANYRGKGISKQLIEKAKELVKNSNACGMFLETGKSNLIGNNLYTNTGFILNENSNYYEWNV